MNTFNFTFAKAGLMLGWGSPVCSFALTCFSCWLWKCLSCRCPSDQSRLRNRSFPNCHFHISPWPEVLYDLIIRIPLGPAVIPAPLVCPARLKDEVLYKFWVTVKNRVRFTSTVLWLRHLELSSQLLQSLKTHRLLRASGMSVSKAFQTTLNRNVNAHRCSGEPCRIFKATMAPKSFQIWLFVPCAPNW